MGRTKRAKFAKPSNSKMPSRRTMIIGITGLLILLLFVGTLIILGNKSACTPATTTHPYSTSTSKPTTTTTPVSTTTVAPGNPSYVSPNTFLLTTSYTPSLTDSQAAIRQIPPASQTPSSIDLAALNTSVGTLVNDIGALKSQALSLKGQYAVQIQGGINSASASAAAAQTDVAALSGALGSLTTCSQTPGADCTTQQAAFTNADNQTSADLFATYNNLLSSQQTNNLFASVDAQWTSCVHQYGSIHCLGVIRPGS